MTKDEVLDGFSFANPAEAEKLRQWHIKWVQLEGEREHRYTETIVAATPALAIEEWSKKSWIHARIDAVYDPQKVAVRSLSGNTKTSERQTGMPGRNHLKPNNGGS